MKARATATLAWLEESGPLYCDMAVTVKVHAKDASVVVWEFDDEPITVGRKAVSYAGWFVLRNTPVDAAASIKFRCDEVGCK